VTASFEHRRLVQLGIRQARYFGRTKTLFQCVWRHFHHSSFCSRQPRYLSHAPYLTAEIRDAILALEAMNQRPCLLIVDFIQMIQDQAESSRAVWAHYGEAVKRLKLIAEEFGVPVIAASQLNRAPTHARRFFAKRSDVQYADSVIALYREKDEAGGSRTFMI